MNPFTYNANYGYIDGVVRGLSNNLLTRHDYLTLLESSNFDAFLDVLKNSSYENEIKEGFLFEGTTDSNLRTIRSDRVALLNKALQKNFLSEWKLIYLNSSGELTVFLEYIRHQYMLSNVFDLLHQSRKVYSGALDAEDALIQLHPIGMFQSLNRLEAFFQGKESVTQIYDLVLMETPLASYVGRPLSSAKFDEEISDWKSPQSVPRDSKVDYVLVRNQMFSAYYNEFFKYCTSLSEPSRECMMEILRMEANCRVFNYTTEALTSRFTEEDVQSIKLDASNLDIDDLISKAKSNDARRVGEHDRIAPSNFYGDLVSCAKEARTQLKILYPELDEDRLSAHYKPMERAVHRNENAAYYPEGHRDFESEDDMGNLEFMIRFILLPKESEIANILHIARIIQQRIEPISPLVESKINQLKSLLNSNLLDEE